MNTKRQHPGFLLTGLEWIARIGSILSVGVLLSLFLAEGFNPGSVAPREWVGLIFFPLGVVFGMVLAWWKEELGALIAVGSLAAFYLIYGFLLQSHIGGWWFLTFTVPGFLFLLHALAARMSLRPAH